MSGLSSALTRRKGQFQGNVPAARQLEGRVEETSGIDGPVAGVGVFVVDERDRSPGGPRTVTPFVESVAPQKGTGGKVAGNAPRARRYVLSLQLISHTQDLPQHTPGGPAQRPTTSASGGNRRP